MGTSKEWREKAKRLDKLFDNQIITLKKLDCPEKVIDILKRHENEVISFCLHIRIPPNRIPFLPVITPAYCKLEELMLMVRNKKEKGRVFPQVAADRYPVIDAVGSQPFLRTRFDPYFVINIEDGTLNKGVEAIRAQKKIISNHRSPLTVAESISLCIHTDVLSRHFLWAAGSRWRGEYRIPEISLTDFGEMPQLANEDISNCHEFSWGTASCGYRGVG